MTRVAGGGRSQAKAEKKDRTNNKTKTYYISKSVDI